MTRLLRLPAGRLVCAVASIGSGLALLVAWPRLWHSDQVVVGIGFAAAVLALIALITLAARRRDDRSLAGSWTFLVLTSLAFVASRLWWALASPTLPFSDFAFYDRVARELASGGPITARWPDLGILAAWGYPVALGGAYALFGADLVVAKLLNVVLGALALLALHALALRVAGVVAARVACMLLLLWPRQLLFTGVVATENLALPLLLSALALAAWLASDRRGAADRIASLALGVLLAVLYLTRSVAGVASVVVLATLAADRAGRRRGLVRCAVAGAAIVVTVLSYRVALREGAGTVPVSGGWWSIYIGSAADHVGRWNLRDAERYAAQPDPQSANRYARQVAIERLAADPASTVLLAPQKLRILWEDGADATFWAFEVMERGVAADEARQWRAHWWVVCQAFHVVVLALGAAGLAVAAARPGSRGITMLAGYLVLGSLAHAVVETQPRYSFTMLAVLLVFGGLALASPGRRRVVRPITARAPARAA